MTKLVLRHILLIAVHDARVALLLAHPLITRDGSLPLSRATYHTFDVIRVMYLTFDVTGNVNIDRDQGPLAVMLLCDKVGSLFLAVDEAPFASFMVE